jgi:NADPH2:quinone reductase
MSAIKDPAMNHANFQQLFDWYDEGLLRIQVSDIADFGDLRRACAQLYAGQAIGKTVIEREPRLP